MPKYDVVIKGELIFYDLEAASPEEAQKLAFHDVEEHLDSVDLDFMLDHSAVFGFLQLEPEELEVEEVEEDEDG